jgi:acetylornithine deacetylase/succinyl-diaminopimelate desuccinylase-like protein
MVSSCSSTVRLTFFGRQGNPCISRIVLSVFFWLSLGSSSLIAIDTPDLEQLSEEGIRVFTEYLTFDTTNPPGREIEAVQFLASILRSEGIPSTILEPVPGRANLYARLDGTGEEPPLLLLQHVDVVPSESDQWLVDPFSGAIRDEAIWGRGALDMKSLGTVHLMTFLALHRLDVPLNRDVILLATADEEAGGSLGLAWLFDNHSRLFQGVGLVLAEGGMNVVTGDRFDYVGVEVTQKVPLWLRLTVSGTSSHGSLPRPDSPAQRLVRALNRVLGYQSPVRVESSVAEFLGRIARLQPPTLQPLFQDPRQVLEDRSRLERFGSFYRSLFLNTINLTVLRSGEATNVVAPFALAELDCRLLPSQDPDHFVEELRLLIADPAIQIERILEFGPGMSPEPEQLYQAIREELEAQGAEAEVGPAVLPGFTDSHYFRAHGIPAYGFSPFPLSMGETYGVHGTNERIGLEDFRSGLAFFYRVVARLVLPTDPVSETTSPVRVPNPDGAAESSTDELQRDW